jgi:hypothetical protein
MGPQINWVYFGFAFVADIGFQQIFGKDIPLEQIFMVRF